jgi:hypothetical protein
MKKIMSYFSLCGVVLGCAAFVAVDIKKAADSVPIQSQVITVANSETPVYIGGYGSSMAYSEADSCFYLLTDRGPNVDGATPESKVFPMPDFVPHIGKFRLLDGELVLVEKIELKEANDTPFSGIPTIKGDGSTNETAYTLKGEVISNNDRRGIDPEGLALAPDGSFWISEEYGPYILHFDTKGNLIEEFSPFNGVLPQHYAMRRPNRGMEGLTINADGTMLFGMMQSPLYYPSKETKNKSQLVRIIAINLADKKISEYLYLLSNARNVISEIEAIDNSTFLVLERDGDFPLNGKGCKHIYKINLSKASNIANDNRPFETMSAEILAKNDIRPVSKELFCDILEAIPNYPHDKPEGIALINKHTLCIVNDDDFGIISPEKPDGSIVPKLSPDGLLDKNKIYFISIK